MAAGRDDNRRSEPGSGAIDRLRIAIVSPEIGSGAGVPHYWHDPATEVMETVLERRRAGSDSAFFDYLA